MSHHNGQNNGPDPAFDKRSDEIPLKVTNALLGSVVGTKGIVGELSSERQSGINTTGNGGSQSQIGSSFRVEASPFKPVRGFSIIPGPVSKKNDNNNQRTNTGQTEHTPAKAPAQDQFSVHTPHQFRLFQSDNHAWSEVRHVAGSLANDSNQSSMSPLINSMLGHVLNGQQSPQSPVPLINYNGSLNSRQPTVEHSPDVPRRVIPVRPEAVSQMPQASENDTSAAADLDIRNMARDLDATMFQGSLANNINFSMSKSRTNGNGSSDAHYPRAAHHPNTAISNNLFDANLLSTVDNVSSNLFGDLSLDEEPARWQGPDSFLEHSAILNATGTSQYSAASRSFPLFSHQATHLNQLGDSSLFSLYDQSTVGDDSNHHISNTSLSNNSNNKNGNRPSNLRVGSELMHSEYPVKHSYPPYHRYGNNPMPAYQASESHLQPHSQPYFPPKRQNWMAENDIGSAAPSHPAYSAAQMRDTSHVDEYAQLSSQFSEDFVLNRGHQNAGKSYSNSNSNNTAAGAAYGSNHPSSRYSGQPRGPSNVHSNSAQSYNPAAPSYPPPRYEPSLQASAASKWSNAPTRSPSEGSRSSYSQSDTTGGYPRSDYDGPSQMEPALAGPHQQQTYEPPLPTTTNVRVGKHRGVRSEGSNSLELRLSVDTSTAGNELRSSGNLLISSVDSDLSTLSGGKHRREHGTDKAPAKSTKEIFKNTFIKPELVESPRSKAAYKDFNKDFRQKEKVSYESAKVHALVAADKAPTNAKWRIYLELADLSKRHDNMDEARYYFSKVCEIQPLAHMGWYEWSKLEEENGDLKEALDILKRGLAACTINETLLTKVIKLHERLHRFEEVREMLGKLKHEPTEKVWKSMLEGSLFEARTGNIPISRKLFKFLINHVPWYGPIYFEAFRMEEKEGCDAAARDIIVRGLKELPRYGPLWFGLFRILERQDSEAEYRNWQNGAKPILPTLSAQAAEAVRQISKELTWKVHFEMSQAQERAAEVAALGVHQHSGLPLLQCRDEMLGDARKSLVRSLLSCPANLRWRVLLVGARLELGVGAIDKARLLLQRATVEVPSKSKSFVYLECSRVEEYIGNLDTARQLLAWAKHEVNREWKVFLEAVLVEARAGLIEKAVKVAREAVKHHPGTGRLWAIYIQLCHRLEMKYFYETEQPIIQQRLNQLLGVTTTTGVAGTVPKLREEPSPNLWLSKERVIRHAITEVPKSGEVWCERARCQLNPLSVHCFDLNQAQRSLCFAIQFTPQYGDTFVEYVRLEMLSQVLLPRVLEVLGLPVLPFLEKHLYEDLESDTVEILLDYRRAQAVSSVPPMVAPIDAGSTARTKRVQDIVALEKMSFDFGNLTKQYGEILIKNLNRRSVNADPNYGSAWFHCRNQPYDIPPYVLRSALHKLVHELADTQGLYARGLFHFIRRTLLQSCLVSASEPAERLTKNRSFVQEDSSPVCSPARSSSAPPGRNREVKASPNHSSSSTNHSGGGAGGSHVKPPPLDFTKSLDGKLKALAQDHSAVNYGLTMMGGRRSPHRDDSALDTSTSPHAADRSPVESDEVTALRECELLEDIQRAGESLGEWPSFNQVELVPFVDAGSGALYCCTDFITGLVEMNRTMFNPNLPEEVRRKNLFGSDQIVS